MAPILFYLFFSITLQHAFSEFHKCVNFEFHTLGGLCKQQSLEAKSMARLHIIRDLLLVDDAAVLANTSEEVQEKRYKWIDFLMLQRLLV